MTLLKWLIIAAACFGGFVALMYVAQRSLMYFPDRVRTPPLVAGLPGTDEVELRSADGETLVAWYRSPQGERPIVLYFHGNAGSLAHRVDRFRAFAGDGLGLLALSYRGYGGSTGRPTEDGLIADGEAAYGFVASRHAPERIVIWGESLGTGVAVAVASRHRVGRVVLESPFTSAADVGARVYWYLPVRSLIKDPFRSDQRIAKVTAPLLILHGAFDRVVPIDLGEKLFALANEPKQFARFAQGTHADLDEHGALAAFRAFLAKPPAGP